MKLNQLKTGAILNYIQLFLGMAISIFVTPFIIRTLGPSEYGILNLSNSLTSYLTLLTFGLSGTFIKFIMSYRVSNDKEGEANFNSMFLII